MRKRKQFLTILAILLSIFALCTAVIAFNEEDVVTQPAKASILYLDQPISLSKTPLYVTGRLFLPLEELITEMGGTVTQQEDQIFQITWQDATFIIDGKYDKQLSQPIYFEDETAYLSLFDISELLHLHVLFDAPAEKVYLYHSTEEEPVANEQTQQRGNAYIRFEDITADGGASGKFTNDYLEKLRAMGSYMASQGQHYYLAWIPLYTNPQKQIQNDLTRDFNLFNADFLYTLDFLTHRNGHIVLHGLTHQENDTVSAIGTEFGENTPFTARQIDERMERAQEIARTLGFDDSIFEFPHYAATKQQMKIAERHFDIIFQPNYRAKTEGEIVKVNRWGHDVWYVPTPLGYVTKAEEIPDLLQKIDELPSDQIRSMFFHPYLDGENIQITTENGYRKVTFSEDSILSTLVEKMTEKNLAFSVFEF